MSATKYNHFFSIVLLNSIHPLSKSLNKFLSNALVFSQYKKGDYIVRSGDFCDRVHITRKGLVRGYFNHNGKEITTWVSVDNELVTSISGYFKKEPALENIQCLEDTFTESLSFNDMHFAFQNFKEMNHLNRILMEYYYLHAEYRAFMARIPTAKDRYEYFLKITNPEIIKRLPNKYLASLLNMRPETLSRLK
ncbi:Crp/Fnr family transcriptional regulator [Confluentibacter citreus]|uniref:Crp/Fnr family transcriptional regulator n=1 Tax=Confluentibacter citreus TaxID=2007307 RepID=UPI000C293EBB|nr:cyclic nucleotide-binding domain-containing protein [Confluentibacter citreus]